MTKAEPQGQDTQPGIDQELIRQFVEHWGMMARAWGINATMGELFALLYISGRDWSAEELQNRLKVSRGNVSMNLRELIAWGVVHKAPRKGERREFYRAESDVWKLFRRILQERRRRELDPTLVALDQAAQTIEQNPELGPLRERIVALQRFFGLVHLLSSKILALESMDLEDLIAIFEDEARLDDSLGEP